MYATISRARLSCNYICVPCLNTTARRARRFPPCLLRNISTTPPLKTRENVDQADVLEQGSKQAKQNVKLKETSADEAHSKSPAGSEVSESANVQNEGEKGGVEEDKRKLVRQLRRQRKSRRKLLAKSQEQVAGDGLVSELKDMYAASGNENSESVADAVPQEETEKASKPKSKKHIKPGRIKGSPIRKVVSQHRAIKAADDKTPKRGPLITKLYGIVDNLSKVHAQNMLVAFLEKNKTLLGEHGEKLIPKRTSAFKASRQPSKQTDVILNSALLDSYSTLEEALKQDPKPKPLSSDPLPSGENKILGEIDASELELKPIDVPQPPVPGVVYGLDRVLFNPGVYQLRDSHSQVYNFDPYLESITPVKEFDFGALKEYITSSRDTALIKIATQEKVKYTGSTSSMTSALAHFHYLLSKWRPLNFSQLSRGFPNPLTSFSAMQRSPTGIFLRWRDGIYAIDASKEFDTANVLMYLGKSMEKFLTASREEYEMFRREHSHKLSEEDKDTPESYHYTTQGDFLMRSQLDAYDPRLPGTGMFDLKTRAVVSIRKDATNFEGGLGYELRNRTGEWESFEREYYDLCRAAFMKYSLQARMGRMDGIFVAYHNVERIFGFQYLPISAMDEAIHGTSDTTLGDQEFKISVAFLNQVLDKLTERFPKQSLQIDFETRPLTKGSKSPEKECFMYIIAQPTSEEEIQAIQEKNLKEITEYERQVIGLNPREQKELVQAGLEKEAREAELEDEAERLEEAIEHPFKPENLKILREAVKKVKEHDTDTENAVHKALEMVESRLREEAAENETESDGKVSEAEAQEPQKPIVGYKILVHNFVNGHEVIRPENLSSNDRWEVKYSIEVLKESTARSTYKALKKRKASLQTKFQGLAAQKSNPYQDKFQHEITEAVKSGRRHRQAQNEKDAEFGIKSLTDGAEKPFTPLKASDVRRTAEIGKHGSKSAKRPVATPARSKMEAKKPSSRDESSAKPAENAEGKKKAEWTFL